MFAETAKSDKESLLKGEGLVERFGLIACTVLQGCMSPFATDRQVHAHRSIRLYSVTSFVPFAFSGCKIACLIRSRCDACLLQEFMSNSVRSTREITQRSLAVTGAKAGTRTRYWSSSDLRMRMGLVSCVWGRRACFSVVIVYATTPVTCRLRSLVVVILAGRWKPPHNGPEVKLEIRRWRRNEEAFSPASPDPSSLIDCPCKPTIPWLGDPGSFSPISTDEQNRWSRPLTTWKRRDKGKAGRLGPRKTVPLAPGTVQVTFATLKLYFRRYTGIGRCSKEIGVEHALLCAARDSTGPSALSVLVPRKTLGRGYRRDDDGAHVRGI
nr:hypothetical protein CFP56_09175 [Quercus suber]